MRQESPALSVRAPNNQAIAAALRLWCENECYDHATIERCHEALRATDTPTAVEQPTIQQEIDRVIDRWRAERGREVHRAR